MRPVIRATTRISLALLSALPLANALAVSPGVTSTRLSDIQQADGDASNLIVSGNGATVCFVADQQTDEARELYCSAADDPQTAMRISGLLPTGSGATFVTLSSDGSQVYYLAPELNGSKVELFRAPTDGSSPATRMNAPLLPADGDVNRFQLLEDQQRVLYSAAAETDSVFELYVVDLAMPGQATKLSGPVVASATGVKQFRLDASSGRVYYTSEQQTVDQIELYGNTLAGGALVKLNAPISSGSFIGSFGFIPGGAKLYYRVTPTSGPTNIWVASATESGTAWQLNQALQADGSANVVAASSDGSRLVFIADVTVDGRFGLFSRALDGSEPQPVTIDAAIVQFDPMTLNPLPTVSYVDSSGLIFIDDYNGNGIGKLQTAAADGSDTPTVLSGGLDVVDFRLAPDRGEAVVIHEDTGNGVTNLAVVKLDASAITPLTNFNNNTGVSSLGSLDAARRYWLFQADPTVNERRDVFALDIETGIYEQRSGTGADLVAIKSVRRAAVGDDGWGCFVEYRQNQMIPTIRSHSLRCTGANGVPGLDFAQVGTVAVGNAPEFDEVRLDPTSFGRVFYIADTPIIGQSEVWQADFQSQLFVDGFED